MLNHVKSIHLQREISHWVKSLKGDHSLQYSLGKRLDCPHQVQESANQYDYNP